MNYSARPCLARAFFNPSSPLKPLEFQAHPGPLIFRPGPVHFTVETCCHHDVMKPKSITPVSPQLSHNKCYAEVANLLRTCYRLVADLLATQQTILTCQNQRGSLRQVSNLLRGSYGETGVMVRQEHRCEKYQKYKTDMPLSLYSLVAYYNVYVLEQ